MSTPTEEARYHIKVRGIEDGPFRLSELAQEGVEPDTLVWVAGSADWQPAHEVPDVARLLDDQWQRVRKASRKAQDLPDPAIFRKLRLAILVIDGPAAFFTIVGSSALLTAAVLAFTTTGRGARMALLVGLLPAILGLVLLTFGAGLLGAFLANCLRIVKVLVPRRDEGTGVSWRDYMQWDLGVLGNIEDDSVSGGMATAGLGRMAGGVMVTLIPGMLLFCIVAIALAPILVVFLPLYIPFALMINRLGYRLDKAIDRYRLHEHRVPWSPITLGFFTALSGLFLLAGPLATAFFVALPIWVHRTARVAEAICGADPERFVTRKAPPKVPDLLSSPFDLPSNTAGN